MVIIRYGEGTEMFRLHEAGKTPSEIIKMLVDSGKCRPYWIGKEKTVELVIRRVKNMIAGGEKLDEMRFGVPDKNGCVVML